MSARENRLIVFALEVAKPVGSKAAFMETTSRPIFLASTVEMAYIVVKKANSSVMKSA